MSEGTGLIRYDAMCSAIVACHSVDEAKEIRARAKALEAYARQALNTEAERKCGQIRLRAERKVGTLLREMTQNGTRARQGERKRKQTSDVARSEKKTVADLGLTYDQSSNWQQLADIPEQEFEDELSIPGTKPTTEGLLSKRKKKEPVKPIDVKALNTWGRIVDFERLGLLESDPKYLLNEMTEPMREDVARLVPFLVEWLRRFQVTSGEGEEKQ